MRALKKFLLLTTALTMVIPCESKAQTLTFDKVDTINDIRKQPTGGGVKISQGADLTFNGGAIWDYSGYHKGGSNVGNQTISIVGIGSTTVGETEFSSDFIVSNGKFSGVVKMYKGHDTQFVETSEGRQYDVVSAGDFRISGGTFDFDNGSELLMKKTASGNFYLESGTFNSSGTSQIKIGSESGANNLQISGGTFNIKENSVISVIGLDIAVSNVTKMTGTGTLSFIGGTTITKDITWEDGTLQLGGGTMSIDSNITVNKYKFASGGVLTIEKDRTLTVRSDFEMTGASSLKGEHGTLRLAGGASATFQKLDNFGTIIAEGAGKGVLSFKDSSSISTISVDNGTLNVDSLLTVGDLTLKNNAKANINAELRVTHLDFDNASINFSTDKQYITLQASTKSTTSTIKNTAKFTFADTDTDGKLVIENLDRATGIALNFDDSENDSETRFSYSQLSVQAKEDTTVNFNQTQGVDLDDVSAMQAIININKGTSHFNSAELGDANSNKQGYLNIASGTALTVDRLTSYIGTIGIAENGFLTLKNGDIYGDESSATVFTGKGTLKVTGILNYKGRFQNLSTLQLDGGAVFNFGGLSGNAVQNLTFSGTNAATLNITTGIFTVEKLNFGKGKNGKISIDQSGTLALDAKGKDVSEIISGTGEISGAGTLELVGSTGVEFGGTGDTIKNLGTLKIGTGTATISGSITIGAVKFGTADGGTLSIAAGKTLNLKEITTSGKNVVTGGGTLTLTQASTFGGQVNGLGALTFSGNAVFNYGQTSSIGTVKGTKADLIVNNGVLTVTNGLTVTGGKVSGTGTLNLTNGGTFAASGALKLTAGGNVVLSDTSVVRDLTAAANASIGIASGKSLTVSGTLSTAAGAKLTGGELILAGTGTFAENAVQVGTLTVQNGAKATFAGNNSVTNLAMNGTAAAVVNGGTTLTLAQDAVGAAQSVFTGSGTLALNKSGLKMNALLSDLGDLSVLQSAELNNAAQVGTVFVAKGAGLVQNADMTVGTVNFAENSGSTLTVNKTLNVTRNIAVALNTLNGTGTLILAGGANGAFATGVSFKDGRLIVGSGTASFTGNTTMGSIGFSGDGGRLNIESGNTLSLSSIATKASNTVTGAGTLRLSGSGSVFDAPISSLGEINIAGGGASFNKNATVGKLSFNGGTATVGNGAVLTVSELTQSGGTFGTVSGGGVLKINSGELSTGGKRIGAVHVGSGTVSVADNSAAGALRFESENGTLNVKAGKTMTVSNAVDISGNLTGDGTLKLENGGVFKKELQGFGTIATDAGTLTFNRNVAVSTIELGGGTAVFGQNATITDAFNLDAGNAVFHGSATQIGKLTMAGAGRATFKNNASITDGASIGGTLDIEDNMLTVENGNLTFADNSALNLRFSASATDDNGVLIKKGLGYGNIVLSSGSVSIGNNVSLNMTVDYGLHTAETGTEFQLLSGTVASGGFSFANSRYKLEKVDCADGDGLCYKLTQDSKAEEVVVDEKGSQNNQNTAAAILDGGLFNEGDKLFEVAKHLDALSQNSKTSRAYLNALTAVAPDVSGSTTAHAVAAQTQIAKAAFNRMNGLQKKMGNRSQKYRQMRELYGRSGGSGYERSLMRTQDYYRRAGYETNDTPASRPYPAYDVRTLRDYRPYEDEKPQRKVKKYRSQRQEDYGAFYGVRPTVGVWAQALYNSNEYKSDSKEDGFSGSTTGLALGVDATFADVFALGFGYAKTTSDLKTLQRSTDVSGNSFFVYGMYKPANWYLTGIANFGSNSFDETKDLSGLIVTDSYDTKTVGGQLMWGLDSTGWNPAVGVRYTAVSRAAHEDPVGQNVASFSNKVFSAVAEVRRDYELSRAGNGVWSSDLSAGLIYDFSRSADSATVALSNGSSYTVEGEDPDAFGAQVGAGIAYTLGGKADISAHYGLEVRPEWFSHTLTATLRVMF